MGKLSTHVLDTMHGKPAEGVAMRLYAVQGDTRKLLKQAVTNHDGRCDAPLLEGGNLEAGVYELVFEAGDYFAGQGVTLPEPRFVDGGHPSGGKAEIETLEQIGRRIHQRPIQIENDNRSRHR